MHRHPQPDLDDENNDVTELYRKTGSAEDIGEDIPMTEEERRARYDLEDVGYELGDIDGNTDAEDEFEALAEEETEGHYGVSSEDFLAGGFHIEDLSTGMEGPEIDLEDEE